MADGGTIDRKQSFILYADIKEPLADLTDEQVGRLLRGILDYVSEGKDPKFRGAVGMAFAFIRGSLDRDCQRYQRKVERRRAAGRSGGIASAEARKMGENEAEQNQANQANASFASKSKQNEQMQANQAVPDPVPDPVFIKNKKAAKCAVCGVSVSEGVAQYSLQRYGKTLCQACQGKTQVQPPGRESTLDRARRLEKEGAFDE